MEIICDTLDFRAGQKTALAIGKFDGLHIGHLQLLSHILRRKGQGFLATAFTFHPSPAVFFGREKGKELTTRQEKRKLFEKMGIDLLVEFPLAQPTAATPAEEFVKRYLAGQLQAGYIAAGADVSFGSQGRGDRELLQRLSADFGYQVQIIDKVYYKGREVSSTFVRDQVEAGNMDMAWKLLGRPYSFEGQVAPGNRLGRRLGMPTLNLYPREEKLLPPMGVYYSRVSFEGRCCPGITNIGQKPTVNETKAVSVETYLYDFGEDMYGKEIVTELLQFKRPEMKFKDVGELKAQMEQDIAQGRQFHNRRKDK